MKRLRLLQLPCNRTGWLLGVAAVLWLPLAAPAAERIVVVEEFTATW